MAKGNNSNMIGSWAFLLGLILAVVVGIFGITNNVVLIILVIAGLIVGLLNVTGREIMPFLLSGTVLIIASALGRGMYVSIELLSNILSALLILFVPATIIVAIKNVFTIARN